MVDIETFLIYLFVLVDDFCQAHPLSVRPGPDWKLSASEAITLLIFGQWARFRSEKHFYRFAKQKLHSAFPNLPSRPRLNRQWRELHDQVCLFSVLYMPDLLEAQKTLYEALDLAAIVTRDAKRRGTGWLAGEADIGKSNRLGWSEGLKMPLTVTPKGVITGFGVAPASAKEQPIAETLLPRQSSSVMAEINRPVANWTLRPRASGVTRSRLVPADVMSISE